jgi:Cys-tRNA(Pro) deacylase
MNVIAYLKENNVWYNLIEKESTVHTADAASATGMPLERITKSLVFIDDKENPIMVIIPGNCRVNKVKLKEVLMVKDVELVSFEKAHEYSGYDPGATPPVCYKKVKKVVIDVKIMQFDTVFGGGGSRKKLIELKPEDIQKLNNAIVADVTEVNK